jgi:hypothetical protein
LGQTKGVLDSDYSDLLAIGANQSDFRNADSVIGTRIANACLLVFCVWPCETADAAAQQKKESTRQNRRHTLAMFANPHPGRSQNETNKHGVLLPGNLEMRSTGGRISTFVPGAKPSEPYQE